MEDLSLDSILSSEEIGELFQDEVTPEGDLQDRDNTDEITEEDPVDDRGTPESVGNEENNKKSLSSSESDTSPKSLYSSIAKALKEEGVLPDIEDDLISNLKGPEDFIDTIEKQVQARLDERQQRIDAALNAGMEPSEIRKYENIMAQLDSIKIEDITDETDKGEKLRKQLIYTDFINRGYSEERAKREVQKSFNSGSDIDDAKEALKSTREYVQEEYDTLREEAIKDQEEINKRMKEEAETLRKSILEDKDAFGDMNLDKNTRKKIFDSISKPIYKDPNTGEMFTAIQKYQNENRVEFLKNLGLIFTLTNGFKSFDSLINKEVTRKVSKSMKELEHTLRNSSISADGNLNYMGNLGANDPESFVGIGKGWDLDV